MLMLQYVDHGIRGTMKNEDIFMEEFAKMCMNLSQFGQDVVEHALEIAIEHRDLRFVVLFIRSLKN